MKGKIAFCFDLDGTVTTQEILPQIAKEVSLFEEIKLLTTITLNGLIPFENSFKLRTKLLSSVGISKVREIVSKVSLDHSIASFIRDNTESCFVVTGNLDVWVGEYIEKSLGCRYYSSVATSDGDTFVGLNSILNKRDAIIDIRKSFDHIVVVGDSMNDCAMAGEADLVVAYGGVHQPLDSLIQLADYVIYDSSSLIRTLSNFKSLYTSSNG